MEYAGVSMQFNDEYDNQKQTWTWSYVYPTMQIKKMNSKKEL